MRNSSFQSLNQSASIDVITKLHVFLLFSVMPQKSDLGILADFDLQ